MRNSYPGICYRCKQTVKTGEGHFENIPPAQRKGAKWRLQHADCAIIYRGTNMGKEILTTKEPTE
jgi:hypothetical protein